MDAPKAGPQPVLDTTPIILRRKPRASLGLITPKVAGSNPAPLLEKRLLAGAFLVLSRCAERCLWYHGGTNVSRRSRATKVKDHARSVR